MPNPGQAVGGNIIQAAATPTITAGAYAAGDAVGGKLEFTVANNGANRGVVVSATLIDKAKQNIEADLFLFSADFTPTADNDPFDPSDADLLNCIGVIKFASGDYFSANDNSVAFVNKTLPFTLTPPGVILYGQLVTRGAPTYASTSDIKVLLGVLQD